MLQLQGLQGRAPAPPSGLVLPVVRPQDDPRQRGLVHDQAELLAQELPEDLPAQDAGLEGQGDAVLAARDRRHGLDALDEVVQVDVVSHDLDGRLFKRFCNNLCVCVCVFCRFASLRLNG